MKKKEGERVKQEAKNIEYLEKKLDEEKAILSKENKRLQKQIYEEIEEANLNKIKFEKKQQKLMEKIQMLKLENERLQSQLLVLEEARNESVYNEDEAVEILREKKEILERNAEQVVELDELRGIVISSEEEISRLKEQVYEYEAEIQNFKSERKHLKRELEKNKEVYKEFQEESKRVGEQLQLQIMKNSEFQEEILKKQAAMVHLKKKNKQFNDHITSLEDKFEQFQKKESKMYEQEALVLRRSKEKLEQEQMILNRKIGFMEIALSQKEVYIESIKNQIDDLKETNESYSIKISQFEDKVIKTENQNRRLIIELQNEKTKCQQNLEEMRNGLEHEIQKAKKKLAEDMIHMFKSGEIEKNGRNMEEYMDALRSYKSQAYIRQGFNNQKLSNEQKKQPSYEKLKFQNQLANLSTENESLKRQIQTYQQEAISVKKQYQQKKQEIEEFEKKVRQLQLIIDRNEHNRGLEEQKYRQEIRNMKNKQTEYLEMGKQYADMEEAMNLKVGYYDRKIKDYIDNIDRKENIIENIKHQRMEAENRAKFMEDKLAVAIEENQVLRKFKNDTTRKDDLLKDYKDRLEKSRRQSEGFKQDIDKLKKQKIRIERNLESKEDYIKTLKEKNLKSIEDRENVLKEEKVTKELKQKEKYEGKLKKLKKQCQGYGDIIQGFRLIIIEKIEESIKKYMGKESLSLGNWQAAEVLGLKSSEIEEFVNPTVNLDRHICEDLDQLWDKGDYCQFMRNSIDYLILKNQKQEKQEE